jgi:type II secretory pathway component HofQ
MTGELEFDLKANMRKIRNENNNLQVMYDKVKATDVPYRWVIIGFVVFVILMGVGSYIG